MVSGRLTTANLGSPPTKDEEGLVVNALSHILPEKRVRVSRTVWCYPAVTWITTAALMASHEIGQTHPNVCGKRGGFHYIAPLIASAKLYYVDAEFDSYEK